jgi:hypothetical protein
MAKSFYDYIFAQKRAKAHLEKDKAIGMSGGINYDNMPLPERESPRLKQGDQYSKKHSRQKE